LTTGRKGAGQNEHGKILSTKT